MEASPTSPMWSLRQLVCVLLLVFACSRSLAWQINFGPLHIVLCAPDVVRVYQCAAESCPEKLSLVVLGDQCNGSFDGPVSQRTLQEAIEIRTSRLTIVVTLPLYVLSFFDSTGAKLLEEPDHDARVFTVTTDLGGATAYRIQQSFVSPSQEALYGMGQYQNGLMGIKGVPLVLQQFNVEIAVPFYMSTMGYGILWDSYARTTFNPVTTQLLLTPAHSLDINCAGCQELSHGTINPRLRPLNQERLRDTRFLTGNFTAPTAGEYHFLVQARTDWGAWDEPLTLSLGGLSVISYVGLTDTPAYICGRVILEANVTYNITLSYADMIDQVPSLFVQYPDHGLTTISSEVGDSLDYYFIYGPDMDSIVAKYRTLTGPAPMFSKSVFGFWQCREHYASQQELLEAAHQFRQRGLPVDNIVQDWLWWYEGEWGPEWDLSRYPDPTAMVQELAALNVQFMVSVWSKFENNPIYESLKREGLLLNNTEWFDPYNPVARERFYHLTKQCCFNLGVQSIWLDATEPEWWPHINKMTALGSGRRYFNTYSLQVTRALYEGFRKDFPNKRLFQMSRSGFAGQQRYAAAVWSGDVSGSWEGLRRQITAGLNYAMSGMPYWNSDIGGTIRPGDQYDNPDFHELLIRWFQFGAFCPIMRVHGGYNSHTEYWNYGDVALAAIKAVSDLRYRLMPYIYSLAAATTRHGYTMMRGLAMDFSHDAKVLRIGDQYMFGPALMACPVIQPGSNRSVYLPAAEASWYNFWTGEALAAGSTLQHPTTNVTQMPLFARGGSILLLGPYLQHVNEKPADPLEVRIYPGRDASFELYEDDGDSNAYELGEFSLIRLSWDESAWRLKVAARQGSYDGMLAARTMHVVLVGPGVGVGIEPSQPHAVVEYKGSELVVSDLPKPEAADASAKLQRLHRADEAQWV